MSPPPEMVGAGAAFSPPPGPYGFAPAPGMYPGYPALRAAAAYRSPADGAHPAVHPHPHAAADRELDGDKLADILSYLDQARVGGEGEAGRRVVLCVPETLPAARSSKRGE